MFMTTLPLWLSGLLLVGLTTVLATCGPVFVRRRVSLEKLRANNEVAGFKFAVVGVLYAVLLAFAVIVVWEKFAEADRTVAKEANGAATLYRLSEGFDAAAGNALRENLTRYLKAAINDEWPAMSRGDNSPSVKRALDDAFAAILSFDPKDNRGLAVLTESLRQLAQVTQARRDRLVTARGSVPGVLWLVLFGGAILTIGFTFFFGTQNIAVQASMTAILSLLIFSGILVITTIDHPFAGPVRVGPEALVLVLEDFHHAP